MRTSMAGALAVVMTIAVAGCAEVRQKMPDWMPGSGAISVQLSGAEEVPPVGTAGSGSGSFRVTEDGSVSGSVTTKNVAGTMAHIHLGARGRNGPVIVPLAKNGDSYSVPAGKKLTGAQLQAFKEGNLYVNVHSNRHKGGEVRAQLQP